MDHYLDISRLIDRACAVRCCSEQELAVWLGVTVRAIRAWRRSHAPRYVALALAAVIEGVDPSTPRISPIYLSPTGRPAGVVADAV